MHVSPHGEYLVITAVAMLLSHVVIVYLFVVLCSCIVDSDTSGMLPVLELCVSLYSNSSNCLC